MRRRSILFDAWRGAYADSPRAISEQLSQMQGDIDLVWTLREGQSSPAGITSVRPFTPAYLYHLMRADLVVANNSMPSFYRKRPGARYLQTWHGTPLKRIAFDIDEPSFPNHERYMAAFARDVGRWDALLSPNRYSSTIFRRAFRYDGPVAEIGYPRNDRVVRATAADRARIAGRLRIPEGKRVILYAPTWRDEVTPESAAALRRDIASWTHSVCDADVLLVRAHMHDPVVRDTPEIPGRVINVSSYPDIADLYVVSDVLVTDYSSAMFDFAVTGRPMMFFTYDLDSYRDKLRGFYFDFEREAPGPVVTDVDELLAQLGSAELAATPTADAYTRFATNYCALDDGEAAARAAEVVLALLDGRGTDDLVV